MATSRHSPVHPCERRAAPTPREVCLAAGCTKQRHHHRDRYAQGHSRRGGAERVGSAPGRHNHFREPRWISSSRIVGAVQVADRWHLLRNLDDAVRAVVDVPPSRSANRCPCRLWPCRRQAAPSRPRRPGAARLPTLGGTRACGRHLHFAHRRSAWRRPQDDTGLAPGRRCLALAQAAAGGCSCPLSRPPRTALGGGLPQRRAALARTRPRRLRRPIRDRAELGRAAAQGRPADRRRPRQRRCGQRTTAVQPASGAPAHDRHRHAARGRAGLRLGSPATGPDLENGIAVAKRLNLLFRRKSQESLDAVLADAASTPLAEFAANIRRDLAAVQAALDLPWTTSPAEGQINRLKMLKLTIHGRAGFQLLRARVLHTA